jgi:hypothetical protein
MNRNSKRLSGSGSGQYTRTRLVRGGWIGSTHSLRPHHELSAEGMAPWPLPNGDPLQASPEQRCCMECGRRLLLIFMESSEWVSHRTEHVSFRDDRTVVRRVTVEFYVPLQAPIFRGDDRRIYRLVPLSVMRRKTLVNFKLRDEEGMSAVLLSLRQNQAITESALLACADIACGQAGDRTNESARKDIANFIHDVVSGEQHVLRRAYESLENKKAPPAVLELVENQMFKAILDRMADNFVLWVMIPAGAPRRRVLVFSSDEPLSLHYRKPGWKGDKYELGPKLKPLTPTVLLSALGFMPTRIRFPVPAAENTASFHFEIDAPPEVQVVEASLLAGRPNEEKPSFDHVQGGFPTVGLHVIEVPNGSLSRVQVDLQVVTRGWLTTSMLSTWAIFGLLFAFASHQTGVREAKDVAPLVLIGLAGGIIGLIAQSDVHALAAHLLKWARSLVTLAVVLLLVVTTVIALEPAHVSRVGLALWAATASGGVIASLLTAVCALSWKRQHKSIRSPWEQNRAYDKLPDLPESFNKAARDYHYDKPAVRVDSAEGWHTEFLWTDDSERQLMSALKHQHESGHLRYKLNGLASETAHPKLKVISLLRISRARLPGYLP